MLIYNLVELSNMQMQQCMCLWWW